MRVELKENAVRVKGENLQIGDLFCIDNPLVAFTCIGETRFLDWLLDSGYAEKYMLKEIPNYEEKELFLALSLNDNRIYIFSEDMEYILLEGKVLIEKY